MEVILSLNMESLIQDMFLDYVRERKMEWYDSHDAGLAIKCFGLYVENVLRDRWTTDDEPEVNVDDD